MPYCFDFTFNFLYLVNVFERKKKTTRRRKAMERRGKMWQGSWLVPPVGAAGGVCPARGRLWVSLAHEHTGVSQHRAGHLGSGLLPGGWSGCQGVARLLFAAPSTPVFPGELCPTVPANGAAAQPGRSCGNNGRKSPGGPGSPCFSAQEALKGARRCQQS